MEGKFTPDEIKRIDRDVFEIIQIGLESGLEGVDMEEVIDRTRQWLATHHSERLKFLDFHAIAYGQPQRRLRPQTHRVVELFDFERDRIDPAVLEAVDALDDETHDAVCDRMKHRLKNLRHKVTMSDFENIFRDVAEDDEKERELVQVHGYPHRVRHFTQPPQCLPDLTGQMIKLIYKRMDRPIANLYLSYLDYASYYEMSLYVSEIQRMQDILNGIQGHRQLFDDMVSKPEEVERVKKLFLELGGKIRDPADEIITSSSMAGRIGALLGCGNMQARESIAKRMQSERPLGATLRSWLFKHPVDMLVPAKPKTDDAWARARAQAVPVPPAPPVPAPHAQSRKRRHGVHILRDSDDDLGPPGEHNIWKARRSMGGTRKRKSNKRKVKKSRKH